MRLAGIALLSVAMPAMVLPSDDLNVRFQHISRADGLSQSYVYAIAQDFDGFLWFGTQEGLNRYDGYEFRVHANDPSDPTSLASNTIRSLLRTADGTLWVGTDPGGLSRYDPVSGTFVNYRHDPDDPTSLSGDNVRVIAPGRDGTIWVGTDGAGLNRFDPVTLKFERFPRARTAPGSLSNDAVWSLVEDDAGTLWIGTDDGLNRLDPAEGTVTVFRHQPGVAGSLSDNFARRLLLDSKGRLWVGTENGGLNLLEPASGRFVTFRHRPGEQGSLSADRVTALFEDKDGRIWVGTVNGLNRWNEESHDFTTYLHDPGNRYSLSNNTVLAIFQDQAGVLWFGSYDGLSYWDTLTGAMRRYSHNPESSTGLSADSVTSFTEEPLGKVWVGTHGGGINVYDRATGNVERLNTSTDSPVRLSSDRVMALATDSDGRIWAGTRSSGIDRIDPESGSIRRYRHDADDDDSLSSDNVAFILRDSRGTLWIATFGGGLNRYDRVNDRFIRFRHEPDDPNSLGADRVVTLFEDAERNLWIGTWGGGLTRLNLATGHFTRIRSDPDDAMSLSGDYVFSIVADRRGDLWIGTQGHGLNRWRREDRQNGRLVFERLTERHGLPDTTIYGAVPDGDGFLWFSTGNGLARLDPLTLEFENYDMSHGLQDAEFNLSAAYRSSDGRLYFGGVNGFNEFDPNEIRGNPFAPPVVLTEFRKLNAPVDVGSTRAAGEAVHLTHKDYVVEFEIAGLDFSAPDKNRYRYRLDGLDEDWVEAGANRRATYTNLAPGRYSFRAMASNNYGTWSEPRELLQLSVAPAPWASWWAYMVYGMIAALLGFVALRAHAGRLRQAAMARHAAEVESMNARLTAEIGEREKKEHQLEREKKRAQTYFNVAEVILLTLDDEGRIRRLNQKGATLLGGDPVTLAGQDWFQFVAEEWREPVRRDLLGKFHAAGSSFRDYLEFPIAAAAGRERLIAWNCTSLAGDDGRPLLFCSGMDVTRVRSLEKQVRLREKMNAIGTLAGGIAHDFNNILQAIYGFTTLALDELEPGDNRTQYLKQVVKGADRARNLVKRILTFSNQKEYDLNAIDLAPVIEEAVALLRGSLPATVEIRTLIDSGGALVLADPTRIHQMIMNLGTNAGQAIGDAGGVIEVRLDAVEIDPEHTTEASRLSAGEYVMLRVSDTGSGMDAQTLDHIYDPFFTTKDSGGSTGLGLTVVHGIVQSHNGLIEVQSRPGAGTTFTVYFPCTDKVQMLPLPVGHDLQGGNERILVVDDEEWVITVTQKILEGQGYQVSVCSSGHTALKMLEQHSDDFDLLITDETMPKMTGSQLMRKARVIRPGMPVIVISGKQAPPSVGERHTIFVQKPFTAEEISESVRRSLDAA